MVAKSEKKSQHTEIAINNYNVRSFSNNKKCQQNQSLGNNHMAHTKRQRQVCAKGDFGHLQSSQQHSDGCA